MGLDCQGRWRAGTGDLTGVALAAADGAAAWFDVTTLSPEDDAAFAEWLADESAAKAMHDAKGPLLAIWSRGWELGGLASDTQLAAYLLRPDQRVYDLADLNARHLRRDLSVAAGGGGRRRPGRVQLRRHREQRRDGAGTGRDRPGHGARDRAGGARGSPVAARGRTAAHPAPLPPWSAQGSRSTSTTCTGCTPTSTPPWWPRRPMPSPCSADQSTWARRCSCRRSCFDELGYAEDPPHQDRLDDGRRVSGDPVREDRAPVPRSPAAAPRPDPAAPDRRGPAEGPLPTTGASTPPTCRPSPPPVGCPPPIPISRTSRSAPRRGGGSARRSWWGRATRRCSRPTTARSRCGSWPTGPRTRA